LNLIQKQRRSSKRIFIWLTSRLPQVFAIRPKQVESIEPGLAAPEQQVAELGLEHRPTEQEEAGCCRKVRLEVHRL
jgi:hypothetical protein